MAEISSRDVIMRRLDGKPKSNVAPEGEIRTVKNGNGGTYKRIKQNGKWVILPKPKEEWGGKMQKYAHLKPNQCIICGEIKPEEEFPKLTFKSKRNPDKIYRRKECKSCRKVKHHQFTDDNHERLMERRRELYQINKEHIKKWRDENKDHRNKIAKESRLKRKAIMIEMLGGKCVDCGATENLQFDHTDPSKKSFNIACVLSERMLTELEKCELRCGDCHLEKTKNDWLSGNLYLGISEDRV
tara:strand:+ start:44 stop:769 length:726 start_codon:yes stop_codon:yes gene_type:complete